MKNIIIIPYRNREKHLNYFLDKSAELLNYKVNNLEIIIVEQSERGLFNRGKLLNIGFHYFNNINNFYITHDVDTNPIHEETFNNYNKDVSSNILQLYSYPTSLGGLIKIRGDTFKKLNGFPNDYWGWGHEDKNFMNRAEFFGIKIETFMTTTNNEKEKYFLIFDDINDRVKSDNDFKKYRDNYVFFKKKKGPKKRKEFQKNGLSNLYYKILEDKKVNDFIRHIKVDI